MSSRTVTTHAEAIRLDLPDLVQVLIDNLGPSTVAALSGAGSRSLPKKWVEGPKPSQDKVDRLRLGYRVWKRSPRSPASASCVPSRCSAPPRRS